MTTSLEHQSGTEHNAKCPLCGQPFTCAMATTCWCVTRTVPPEVATYLAEHYTTCLCSHCLDSLIAKAASGESL